MVVMAAPSIKDRHPGVPGQSIRNGVRSPGAGEHRLADAEADEPADLCIVNHLHRHV